MSIPHNRVCLRSEDAYVVEGVVRSGQIGPGPHVEAFEDELAERFRPGGAAAVVSSGTAALRLALIALQAEQVSIPTYACVALYHAASDTVLPVPLVDCEPDTLCAHEADVIVHTYGAPCPAAAGALIEDFTHAPGVDYGEYACGSMGTASVISFGATKPLGCGGGGAVLGAPDVIEAVKDMRDYDGKRTFRPRFNWQANEMVAALGRQRLARLDAENDWRRAVAAVYAEVCRSSGIRIYADTAFANHYRFVIRVPDVAAAVRHFAACGIETICPLEPWELLHRQLGLDAADFPNAEDAAAHTVSLPIWPGMGTDDVGCVVETLKGLGEA